MKNKTILMTAALIVLAVVVTTFGQANENPAELKGEQARERWQNMSDEEKREARRDSSLEPKCEKDLIPDVQSGSKPSKQSKSSL